MNGNKSLGYTLSLTLTSLAFPFAVLIFGTILVFLGAYADVKISFVGQKLESTSVGVAIIFFASLVYLLTFRKVLNNISGLE